MIEVPLRQEQEAEIGFAEEERRASEGQLGEVKRALARWKMGLRRGRDR
jgi:hypothetical protein